MTILQSIQTHCVGKNAKNFFSAVLLLTDAKKRDCTRVVLHFSSKNLFSTTILPMKQLLES